MAKRSSQTPNQSNILAPTLREEALTCPNIPNFCNTTPWLTSKNLNNTQPLRYFLPKNGLTNFEKEFPIFYKNCTPRQRLRLLWWCTISLSSFCKNSHRLPLLMKTNTQKLKKKLWKKTTHWWTLSLSFTTPELTCLNRFFNSPFPPSVPSSIKWTPKFLSKTIPMKSNLSTSKSNS